MIRPAKPEDFTALADIWLAASLNAHDFIPPSYWEGHYEAMCNTYLPTSTIHVAEDQQQLLGFIALMEDQIAALFVHPDHQGKGIGRSLLAIAKALHPQLKLNVYAKNQASVRFYTMQGFEIMAEQVDSNTGEAEFRMLWKRNSLS